MTWQVDEQVYRGVKRKKSRGGKEKMRKKKEREK
jgi:hypothetical protein